MAKKYVNQQSMDDDDEYYYYCSICGAETKEGATRCPSCGARLHPEGTKIPSQQQQRLGNVFDTYFGAIFMYWALWIAPIAWAIVILVKSNGINGFLALPLLVMAFFSGRPLYRSIKYKHQKTSGVTFKVIGFVRYIMLLWIFGWSCAALLISIMIKFRMY